MPAPEEYFEAAVGMELPEALPDTADRGAVVVNEELQSLKALHLRAAGWTIGDIARALKVEVQAAHNLVEFALKQARAGAASSIEQLRALENVRLDRLQRAFWSSAIDGDRAAAAEVGRIMDRRARLNGTNAPTQINLNAGLRVEMELALQQLEQSVQQIVLEGSAEEIPEETAGETTEVTDGG